MDAACLIDELLLQKSLALTVINVTKLNFPCYSEVIKRFIFTLNCILHMVLKKKSELSLSLSLYIYIYIHKKQEYICVCIYLSIYLSPPPDFCTHFLAALWAGEYLICTYWKDDDYSVPLAAADVSIQWHFVWSLTMAMFQQWCCFCGSYRNTLYVLKLYVAQRNQTVVFVVLLRQVHSLSGFTPLSVVKTHWPREIDEHLHRLRGLGCQRRKEKWSRRKEEAKSRRGSQEGEKEAKDIFLAISKFLKSQINHQMVEEKKKTSPNSEDCIFIEKSFTGWLNAIVISN